VRAGTVGGIAVGDTSTVAVGDASTVAVGDASTVAVGATTPVGDASTVAVGATTPVGEETGAVAGTVAGGWGRTLGVLKIAFSIRTAPIKRTSSATAASRIRVAACLAGKADDGDALIDALIRLNSAARASATCSIFPRSGGGGTGNARSDAATRSIGSSSVR
jgi:hypothetical protein